MKLGYNKTKPVLITLTWSLFATEMRLTILVLLQIKIAVYFDVGRLFLRLRVGFLRLRQSWWIFKTNEIT
jgi:hypothetical protein